MTTSNKIGLTIVKMVLGAIGALLFCRWIIWATGWRHAASLLLPSPLQKLVSIPPNAAAKAHSFGQSALPNELVEVPAGNI